MGIRRNNYKALQDIGYRTFSDDAFRVYKEKIGGQDHENVFSIVSCRIHHFIWISM